MDSETINLTNFICDFINNIFLKIFSSIDNTLCSNLDSILFIHPDITSDAKFQQFFGTDLTNGLLLIVNSLIFGIVLFYILKFAISHLTYSKIDSPYQFVFKCIIFIVCMNSSLWICQGLIFLISLLSDFICEIGSSICGYEIHFSNLIHHVNSILYPSLETLTLFSFNGILKAISSLGIVYISLIYAVRYLMCKIFVLLAPFAFVSLINNHFDGFFKGWLKQFLSLLCMQIWISIVLVLGFTLEFQTGNILSEVFYLAILTLIIQCSYHVKQLFLHIFDYSHHKLKDFI